MELPKYVDNEVYERALEKNMEKDILIMALELQVIKYFRLSVYFLLFNLVLMITIICLYSSFYTS